MNTACWEMKEAWWIIGLWTSVKQLQNSNISSYTLAFSSLQRIQRLLHTGILYHWIAFYIYCFYVPYLSAHKVFLISDTSTCVYTICRYAWIRLPFLWPLKCQLPTEREIMQCGIAHLISLLINTINSLILNYPIYLHGSCDTDTVLFTYWTSRSLRSDQ